MDSLRRGSDGFELKLSSGETVNARRVVVATGIQHFRHIPEQLQSLPSEFVSHSYDHHDLSPLVGRRVAVLGGGASAIDLAGLLKKNGCDVQIVCRREKLLFADPPGDRSLWQRVRRPRSGLGPGLKSQLSARCPARFSFHAKGFPHRGRSPPPWPSCGMADEGDGRRSHACAERPGVGRRFDCRRKLESDIA